MQKDDTNRENTILKGTILPALLSLVGAIIALYPNNPNNVPVPSRDSGVFLYIGWRILNGDIPYRDVWDHKPPLIYYIDALGLSLTPKSLWGVWTIEFIFIFLTILLIYKALNRELGIFPALTGTIILTSGLLSIINRGNVTEEYALVFQALCIYLFIRAREKNYPPIQMLWIGLCGGMAFYFKQTTIGVWITFVILLVLTRIKQKTIPISEFIYLMIGWSLPIVIFTLYFYVNHALGDLWNQVFIYNFLYIKQRDGIRHLIATFIKGFAFLKQGWVLYFALAGWLAGVFYLWIEKKDFLKGKNALILFSVVDLPIELMFILVSSHSILHYYLAPLPVMALLSGIVIYIILQIAGKFLPRGFIQNNIMGLGLLAIVILAQVPKAKGYREYMESLVGTSRLPIAEYIVTHTDEKDKVLIIGAESVVNFLTQREAPTRYVYQYPLALTGNQQMFEEYFNQIIENKPVLIIDTRGKTEITDKLYLPLQKRSEVVRDGVKYLGENYEHVAQFGDWFIYKLKGSQ
ncbi:MAG: glycosyltransferase family 39 protein [Anaerolineales bacterium]|nr:glycosyltransferase family 39 protein [Anaerolineales bacterium]